MKRLIDIAVIIVVIIILIIGMIQSAIELVKQYLKRYIIAVSVLPFARLQLLPTFDQGYYPKLRKRGWRFIWLFLAIEVAYG